MLSFCENIRGGQVRAKIAAEHIEEKMQLLREGNDPVIQALSESAANEVFDASEGEYENPPSSDSDADSESSSDVWVPRAVMLAFREAHGQNLKARQNKNRFTKLTNPMQSDKLQFMLAENVVCP